MPLCVCVCVGMCVCVCVCTHTYIERESVCVCSLLIVYLGFRTLTIYILNISTLYLMSVLLIRKGIKQINMTLHVGYSYLNHISQF